jgi:hypothetical protein
LSSFQRPIGLAYQSGKFERILRSDLCLPPVRKNFVD